MFFVIKEELMEQPVLTQEMRNPSADFLQELKSFQQNDFIFTRNVFIIIILLNTLINCSIRFFEQFFLFEYELQYLSYFSHCLIHHPTPEQELNNYNISGFLILLWENSILIWH